MAFEEAVLGVKMLVIACYESFFDFLKLFLNETRSDMVEFVFCKSDLAGPEVFSSCPLLFSLGCEASDCLSMVF